MASYWFRSLQHGEKVVANTVQEISRLAQREADKFGGSVQVHSGEAGRKSHRKVSMARNPIGSASGGLVTYNQGRKAAKTGKYQGSNPHRGKHPEKAAMWDKGWLKGRNEMR